MRRPFFCFDVRFGPSKLTSQLRIGEIACDFLLVCNFAGVLLVSLSSQRVLGRGLTGIVNCDSSRLGTEAFLEKSARLPLRSSSAWAYSLIMQPV